MLRIPTTTAVLNPAPPLFGRNRVFTIAEGTPRQKISGAIDWSGDALGATLRTTYYGQVNQPGTAVNGSADILTGKHVITDLELRYASAKGAQVAIGANGRTKTVSLLPANLDASPLGGCVKNVLKRTEFPKGQDTSFQIPLSLKGS